MELVFRLNNSEMLKLIETMDELKKPIAFLKESKIEFKSIDHPFIDIDLFIKIKVNNNYEIFEYYYPNDEKDLDSDSLNKIIQAFSTSY